MRAILGFIAFVAVIIFLIIVIVRGGDDPRVSTTPRPELASAAASDASFSFTDTGPITAEEEHYRIRINVTRSTRSIQIYRGYGNTIVAAKQLDNTTEAFEHFLSALDRAGYTNEKRTNFESEAGLCPSGRRYVFESDQFDDNFRRWTTSCRGEGNFGGSLEVARQLFTRQIPEYQKFISETRRATGLNVR